MNKKGKVMSVLLASTLAVMSFAGCGAGKKASDKLGIGGIGPTTGGAAQYGTAVKNGAMIAVDEINKAGGIGGIQIEFKFEDDQHDPEKSVNAYNSLKDWGMQILMGTTTTDPCVAVASETKKDNMFQLTPSASSTEVIKGDNVFQVCFTDPNQGAKSADYIADNNIAKKVAVIYDSSEIYSSGIYKTFVEEAGKKGLEIVSDAAFTKDTNTDFSTQLNKAKSAGAELIFLPIYYAEASKILQQADAMGYKPKFFGCDGLDGLLGVKGFDKKLAESVMLLTPFAADAKDERTKNFVKAYQDAYKEIPIQFAANAYDAIYIIKEAAEKSGVKANMKTSEICELMKKAMIEITIDGLTGEGMKWDATGAVSKPPKAVMIKNGAYVSME